MMTQDAETSNELVPIDQMELKQVTIDHALPFAVDQLADLLEEIAQTGTIWSSCKRLGIPTSTYLRARTTCKPLAKLHDAALAAYADKLRLTLHQRAVEGIEKGVWFQGQQVGTERVYSDRLLELQLKRHDPAYKDKVQHDHQHGGGVLVVHAPAAGALNQADWHANAKQVERVVQPEYEQLSPPEPGGGAEADNE